MHAYLIIAKDQKSLSLEVRKIIDPQNYKLMEFSVQKIDDARALNFFIKFSINEKTAIFIKNFQSATEECTNAILKIIEEPQDSLIFIIHSKSENSLLPTIKSRCQIIYTRPVFDTSGSTDIGQFLKSDLSEMADYLYKYKKREEAIAFTEKLIDYFSRQISKCQNVENISKLTKAAVVLNNSLKLNANVNLAYLSFLAEISN